MIDETVQLLLVSGKRSISALVYNGNDDEKFLEILVIDNWGKPVESCTVILRFGNGVEEYLETDRLGLVRFFWDCNQDLKIWWEAEGYEGDEFCLDTGREPHTYFIEYQIWNPSQMGGLQIFVNQNQISQKR